jgi:hypothetical protein
MSRTRAKPERQQTVAPERAILSLRITPGAHTCSVEGRYGDAIKVRVSEPPEDGRANAALLIFLAERLGLPRSALQIERGLSSRSKVVSAEGVSQQAAEHRLLTGESR